MEAKEMAPQSEQKEGSEREELGTVRRCRRRRCRLQVEEQQQGQRQEQLWEKQRWATSSRQGWLPSLTG